MKLRRIVTSRELTTSMPSSFTMLPHTRRTPSTVTPADSRMPSVHLFGHVNVTPRTVTFVARVISAKQLPGPLNRSSRAPESMPGPHTVAFEPVTARCP